MQAEFDEAARAEEYKRKGHALWANIGQLSGRPAQVELADLFDSEGGSTLRIDLDINRSLAEKRRSLSKGRAKIRAPSTSPAAALSRTQASV